MIIAAGGRGAGKSFKLAAWALAGQPVPVEPGWSRLIVVSNKTMRRWFVEQFGVPEHIVFTIGTLNEWKRGKLLDAKRHHIEIGVDEPGILLSSLLGFPVRMLAVEADAVYTTAASLIAGNGYVDTGEDGGPCHRRAALEFTTMIGDADDATRIDRAHAARADGNTRAEYAPGLYATANPGRPRFDRVHIHEEASHDEA
jgi:hypothetical protein